MSRSPSPPILEVSGLSVRYGQSVIALQGVDLRIAQGEAVTVLGANGAGKSSLLRAISRTLSLHRGAVTSGDVRINGEPALHWSPTRMVRAGVVQVPEGRHVFAGLTVQENLRAGALTNRSRKARERAMAYVLDLFPRLADRMNQRAGLLSGGEQQMLALGRALMSEPRVLLLDEPSLGLAPRLVTQVGEIIRQVNERGVSVLLVEQNAAMALSVASSAVVIENGRVARAGAAAEFQDQKQLAAQYLGSGPQAERLAALRRSSADEGPTLRRWSA
ncbi:ABC transporter ATP-binding protein [Nonomuraea wenchangensis]|uniref:ABC transporter ATP-binding protein n=1 Tax=Nonomuraea wenchangensis TaxID=568860 RepID=UPI00372468F7